MQEIGKLQKARAPTRSGKGQRKPRSVTKADEPSRSREWQHPTSCRKKCLANPLREKGVEHTEIELGEKQNLDHLPVAATTDRTPTHANFSDPGRFRTKAAAALQTNEREPVFVPRPGRGPRPEHRWGEHLKSTQSCNTELPTLPAEQIPAFC